MSYHVLFAPAVCLLLAGCGGGGGGGGAARTPGASIRELTVAAQGDDAFAVGYQVTPVPEPVRLTLEYSEDRGTTFHTSAAVAGQTVLAQGSDRGELVWCASDDIGSVPQGDLVVRVTPFGAQSGTPGTPAVSVPFAYLANSVPEVTAVAAADSPTGSPTAISVTGRDAEGDTVVFRASYSTDGGATFAPADTWGPVRLPPEGASAQFQWNALQALGEGDFVNVRIKVVAEDASGQDERVSAPFDLVTLRPRVAGITVEGVPLTMNGSEPFTNLDNELETYRLLVPERGFTIQVYFETEAGGGAIDTASLSFTANRAIGPSSEIAAGTELGALFLTGEEEAVLTVTDSLVLPPGALAVTATIADQFGNTSEPCVYEITVESPGEAFSPFARPDLWGLAFTRDNWTIAAACANGTVTITPTFGPNGAADFIDDLTLLGLYDAQHPEVGARAASLVKERILANLRGFYSRPADGVLDAASSAVEFTLSTAGATSSIAMGGADPAGGYTLGRAYFDRGNSRYDQNAAASLGIFSTNLIRFYINTSFTFKNLFDAFIPGRGQPIGTAPEDARVLSDAFVPGDAGNTEAEEDRYAAITAAADGFGRALAAIAAHEIGHSLGLVANGPPPSGLFGGEKNAEFAGTFTDQYHLDTPGNNVMESSMSFSVTRYTGTRTLKFNPLNMAYLLARILVRR